MPTKSIRTVDQLISHELIDTNEAEGIKKVVDNFAFAMTNQMQELIDKNDPNDAIAKQFVPHVNELNITPRELADPIGDKIHTKVKGVVHRYPDRCLFTPVHVCPVYCRFCFRREVVGTAGETLSPEDMEAAFTYIEKNPTIWEVILTGGDPLILKPQVLKKILTRLNNIKHIEIIRIHTRVPVVDSARITQKMVSALKGNKPVYVVLHANHPDEFTEAAKKACDLLIDSGIPMLSQSILLKDINDNIETLSSLMRCFIRHRIKPYYLHHPDLAKGTQHFRISIEKGQELMRQLRGRFSGICQPTYVLDIPNGFGKVPVGPSYITACEHAKESSYNVEDYHGSFHFYQDSV